MEIDMMSVGNRIKQRRHNLNLTQIDIYKKCGIASGALSQIENGTRTPSVIIFYKLAQALECSMDWLLTGSSTNSENGIFSENEETLLNGFRNLSEEDQNELIQILEIKLNKNPKVRNNHAQSFNSQIQENDHMAG